MQLSLNAFLHLITLGDGVLSYILKRVIHNWSINYLLDTIESVIQSLESEFG